MRKSILLAVAVLGVALLWGSAAEAQCVTFVPNNNVIVQQSFVPAATFQSFGSFGQIVPTNGVFFGQPVIVNQAFPGRTVVVNRAVRGGGIGNRAVQFGLFNFAR